MKMKRARMSFERSVKLTLAGAAGPGAVGAWANEIEELVGSGDMAVARSTRTFTHTLAGGGATSVKMRLLDVYRRYHDGSSCMARFLGFPG